MCLAGVLIYFIDSGAALSIKMLRNAFLHSHFIARASAGFDKLSASSAGVRPAFDSW